MPDSDIDLATELDLARSLADAADVITMRHYRSTGLVVETKADRTEVTIADRDSEHAIRQLLAQHRPSHGILGEEHGISDPNATFRWIIDPIDGTSNYVRGVPVWATLIALEANGVMVVGVVSCPALGKRWWAAKGLGAFADGRPIRVSSVASLEDAFLSYSEGPWADRDMRGGIDALRSLVARERAFGDFWQHMLVAEGAIDVAAEAIVSLWDLAAIQVIVEEAGGTFTDLAGEARAAGGSALSTNSLLHLPALAVLRAS